MQTGQFLSLLDIKEVNIWVKNPCSQSQIQEFGPEKCPHLLLFQEQRKVSNAASPALLLLKTFNQSDFIHSFFIVIIVTIITIINHSSFGIARLCRVQFCLPSSWCFSGICLYRSAASQQEPLFPHLFSLSPQMISSDRYDS